jgi:hypothetical protein
MFSDLRQKFEINKNTNLVNKMLKKLHSGFTPKMNSVNGWKLAKGKKNSSSDAGNGTRAGKLFDQIMFSDLRQKFEINVIPF